MSSRSWHRAITPSRLVAVLCLLTASCAILIADFSIDAGREAPGYAERATKLNFVHQIVEQADVAKESLHKYEATQQPADKEAFLRASDDMAATVSRLRFAEHMSEEQSDQIIDLCVAIRQQLNKLGSTNEDRMLESGYLVDRIRRVVLGFGIDELRDQDRKLQEQTSAAAMNRRMTMGMAIIEVFLVAGIVFLVIRLTRLEQLVTVCAWSHRILYEGQWMNLDRYLEERFGIRASEGITTEQAAKLMAQGEANAAEILRLAEFEKAAGARAKEANRVIHAVRNHLTAVLCYSEMAGNSEGEAQREMAVKILKHATTMSGQVQALDAAVRGFNPGAPDLHILRKPGENRSAA